MTGWSAKHGFVCSGSTSQLNFLSFDLVGCWKDLRTYLINSQFSPWKDLNLVDSNMVEASDLRDFVSIFFFRSNLRVALWSDKNSLYLKLFLSQIFYQFWCHHSKTDLKQIYCFDLIGKHYGLELQINSAKAGNFDRNTPVWGLWSCKL